MKAEMEAIQQQMAEANKNGRNDALREIRVFAKSLGLLLGL